MTLPRISPGRPKDPADIWPVSFDFTRIVPGFDSSVWTITVWSGADANAAATDFQIGVTGRVAAGASGDRVDVIRAGIAPVEYSATVVRGAALTADANGKAVTAAPAAGANARIIGMAEISGVSGDIGSVFISPGVMQG